MGTLPLRSLTPLDEIKKFAIQQNMAWRQENGQRIFGPPINCNTQPPKGTEIYVTNLPRNANEMDLFTFFRLVGPIYEIRLMMDFSGHNRGYSFIRYFNVVDAHKAIRILNNKICSTNARPVRVVLSYDNCFLFLRNFPHRHPLDIKQEALRVVTRALVRATVIYDTITSFGCLLEFESHRDAALARAEFLKGTWRFWGGLVSVEWANEEDKVKPVWR